mmetsp:Transcript_30550/g.93460  ORF Transcript_30550/g.93460 Transcript_30550/m.93460 type:complete len:97 (-) Transcript_30550:1453-1743(-)
MRGGAGKGRAPPRTSADLENVPSCNSMGSAQHEILSKKNVQREPCSHWCWRLGRYGSCVLPTGLIAKGWVEPAPRLKGLCSQQDDQANVAGARRQL